MGKETAGNSLNTKEIRQKSKAMKGRRAEVSVSQADSLTYCLTPADSSVDVSWDEELIPHNFTVLLSFFFGSSLPTEAECSSWTCYSAVPFWGRTAFEVLSQTQSRIRGQVCGVCYAQWWQFVCQWFFLASLFVLISATIMKNLQYPLLLFNNSTRPSVNKEAANQKLLL